MSRPGARTALVGAVLVITTACSSNETTDPAAAVVHVAADGCSLEPAAGTGVAVDVDGTTVVLTSAHTVAGASAVTLAASVGSAPARLVGFDPELDVAVLVTELALDPLALARPSAGATAAVVLADTDGTATTVETRVDRLLRVTIEDIYRDADAERQAFEFAATIEPGDSGAPVVDADGAVIGMVYARSRERGGIGFAISGTDLLAMLATVDPATSADPGPCL